MENLTLEFDMIKCQAGSRCTIANSNTTSKRGGVWHTVLPMMSCYGIRIVVIHCGNVVFPVIALFVSACTCLLSVVK